MRILLTGAGGFIGKALFRYFEGKGHFLSIIQHGTVANVEDIAYDCLIHLAGLAHLTKTTSDDLALFKEANVSYSLKIAKLAKELGVKRFVYLSSIKVNGDYSLEPFTENDLPKPLTIYGITKLQAEQELKEFCKLNDMELVIIRPPLVYGAGVKANFKSLIELCKLPIPLPFKAVKNKRSLISLENLINFIELCCLHKSAANETFLISDDYDVSTAELIYHVRKELNHPPHLIYIPTTFLEFLFKALRKSHLNERLLSDLQIDTSKAKELLNWKPAISFEKGIQHAVRDHAY